jgi:RND family efflux transporter MFP subunit
LNPTNHPNQTNHTEAVAMARRIPPKPADPIGRRLGLAVIALAVVLGLAFLLVYLRKSEKAAALAEQASAADSATPTVNVMAVQEAPPTQPLVLPGVVRGWYQSIIYARVSGYVGQWYSDIGDRVKKDQVLATIDTPDLDAQLQAAEHELAIAQSQVQVAQANEEFARTTYNRWRESPKGVVSDQERDQKKSEYDGAVANVKAAESKVSADQSEVNQITAIEAFKRVAAPFDGVITARRIDIGDLVTAGSTSNTTSLYGIAQLDKVRVYVDVPQNQSAATVPGVEADATAGEFPDRVFHGTVTRTSNSIDPATGTLHVEVDLPNPDLRLKPGMYLRVNIHVPHPRLLQVRAAALIFHADGPYVAVVGDGGTIQFHRVTIGVDNGDVVDLASGVSPTDKVVLNLSNQIVSGDKVDAVDADTPAPAPAPATAEQSSPANNHTLAGVAAEEK